MAEPGQHEATNLAEIRALADECVHCGFCLPTCPTYVLWGEEMDSPRGRIHLLQGLLDEDLMGAEAQRVSSTVATHFDRCLGCMACLTSCPSGVAYDRLIEEARTRVEEADQRTLADRVVRGLVFHTVPYPARLRAALALERLGRHLPLPGWARPLVTLAPPWRSAWRAPRHVPALGQSRGAVGVLVGCVQRIVFGDVNAATVRVLSAEGFDVVAPRQGCCGALSVHAGRLEEGRERARRLIDAFPVEDLEAIIVNAAGCGSTLKEYGHLLRDDPAYAARAQAFSERVRDVSEFLATTSSRAPAHPLGMRVALQDSCHLVHAQGVGSELRVALGRIPELETVEPGEQELCCGSAGIYNLVQPDAAAELGRRKGERILETSPDAYASANPGCLIQVNAALRAEGQELPALHPIEMIDASLRGVSASELLGAARRQVRSAVGYPLRSDPRDQTRSCGRANLILSLGASARPPVIGTGDTPEVDVLEAARRLESGAAMLDVREPLEWEAGRVGAAVHIPLGQLSKRHAELDASSPLLVICRSGSRSANATKALCKAGYDAYNVAGGMQAWVGADQPIEPESGFVAQMGDAKITLWGSVQEIVARAPSRFVEASERATRDSLATVGKSDWFFA